MIGEIVLFDLHSICIIEIICACFHFLQIVLLARDLFVTFSWIVQHCRGLSNLSWHEILDDLPNTWEMRHRNRVAFVPWPCKVTLTCCSATPTPTGGVRNTPTRSFWRYAGSMKTRQFWVKRRISITDRNCEPMKLVSYAERGMWVLRYSQYDFRRCVRDGLVTWRSSRNRCNPRELLQNSML